MSIEMRLENWARAWTGGFSEVPGGSGLVANIYFPSVRGQPVNSAMDLADAARVEQAMRTIMPIERQMLKMHYVWRKPSFVICRRLGIKPRPTSTFDLWMARAKQSLVNALSVAAPRREYVSMQAVIDRLAESRAAADLDEQPLANRE
ncbi:MULTISPECIES: hypothetical protein [Burkholderia]|uniref:hypothetical protein n=1 Tax=Burkholderia TaxID=32008 RepID=UPI002036811E|nr:hypothetical protein [Burkholderia glumae]MCM2492676.1 hypothetical protein [Burkholderia glumae]